MISNPCDRGRLGREIAAVPGSHIQYKPRLYGKASFIARYFLSMDIHIFNNIGSCFNYNYSFAMINKSNKAQQFFKLLVLCY